MAVKKNISNKPTLGHWPRLNKPKCLHVLLIKSIDKYSLILLQNVGKGNSGQRPITSFLVEKSETVKPRQIGMMGTLVGMKGADRSTRLAYTHTPVSKGQFFNLATFIGSIGNRKTMKRTNKHKNEKLG